MKQSLLQDKYPIFSAEIPKSESRYQTIAELMALIRAEKIAKIAAELDVTTEFLLTESATTPDEEVLDEAFFRKYKTMSEPDKKKIRKIIDAWEDE